MLRFRLTWRPVVSGLFLALATSVVAADDSIDTVVVTASRIDRPPEELVTAVQVIDREDILARQVTNVTELLRQLTGANIIQQGARGGITSLVLRGGEPNFTVVMIDGIKVNDSTNTRGGSYDFSYLDINNVERVEVVRGPMSAVYGSDALSGVVNIITRQGEETADVTIEAGGHGLTSGNVTLAGRLGAVEAIVNAHTLSEDGDIEGSSYEDAGASASLRTDFGNDGEAGGSLRYLDADSTAFPEDSGGPLYAVVRDVDRRSVTETHARIYVAHTLGSRWRGQASISRYDRDEQSSSPGIAPGVFDGVPPNSADTDFTRDQLSVSASAALNERFTTALGAEWQREKGVSVGVIDIGFPLPSDFRLDRETLSAFAEIDLRSGPLRLQGSLRWDDPDEIEDELSTQLGAIYALPGDSGELRVNWGQGFKAPSFFALAHPLVGNPDLVSETAESLDVGYRRQFGDSASVQVNVYRNDYKNLIDFDPVLFTNVNRSRVVAQGAEFSAGFPVGDSVFVDGHVTYADTDIRGSDAILRGRPKWRGGVVATWTASDKWLVSGSLLVLDDFWEVSIPTGGMYLDGYERLDLAVTYDVSDAVRLGFAIDNVLDADYQEAVGFPAAGIRGRVNATLVF